MSTGGASLFSRGYATGSAGNHNGCCCRTATCWRRRPSAPASANYRAQRLSVVTLQGEWISATNRRKRSLFTGQSVAPACKAIVHLHSHYLTALSHRAARGLDPHNCIAPLPMVMRVGDVGGSLLPAGR
ncbi:class II aldolase/adducin family protein [Klebsiella pneumoniae]|nr:class II aldolase/adducin family protein [Klebsiella pneumoniae]